MVQIELQKIANGEHVRSILYGHGFAVWYSQLGGNFAKTDIISALMLTRFFF